MILTQSIIQILSILTLISNIVLGLFFIYFIIVKLILGKSFSSTEPINAFFKKNALLFAFIIALVGTSGSLFYSEIAGYEPCKLCWFQRIFMYPLTILLGIALIKNDFEIADYVIPLSVIGGLISTYHYYIQRVAYSLSCGVDAVSCTTTYSFYYGYITIPIMALTAFVMIIVLTYICKEHSPNYEMI